MQEKNANGKNRETFHYLLKSGWSPADARRGMIRLNRIKLVDLARGQALTPPVLQKTLLGDRRNPLAMKLTAESVNVPVHEFYPEETP